MAIEFLLDVFRAAGEADAIVWRQQVFSYSWLVTRIDYWRGELAGSQVDVATGGGGRGETLE